MIGLAHFRDDQEIAYFATTFDQARNIAWTMLKEFTHGLQAKPPNESRLELYIKTSTGNTSRITLRGYESVETTRGQQFDLIVCDEVAQMKNFQYTWSAILQPTLAFRKGKAVFIGTPRGFNHFSEMYEWGQKEKGGVWKSWLFTSYDNPFLDRKLIEQAKQDSPLDWFNQEYLAQFMRYTGLIYKEFTEKMVQPFEHIFDSKAEYLFGQDFATRGNNAAVAIKIMENNMIYILDCVKKEGLTSQEFHQEIESMLLKYAPINKWVGYADPAGWMTTQQGIKNNKPMQWSLADEYLEMGLSIIRANNQVNAGINYVRQLFQQERIIVHPRCQDLIDEISQYQWKEQPKTQVGERSEPEEPRKINDHLVDALRYALYSKPVAPEPEAEKPKWKEGEPLMFKPWWEKTEVKPKYNDKFTPVKTNRL
jgi:hypothetical protein